MNKDNLRNFCVAPMMGYTTPHARFLYRILSKKCFLFTEMIPSNTMLHHNKRDLIIKNNNSNPVALQVGGSDIKELTKCTKIAKEYNYDEINLNLGCPSKAVQKGSFGACLMQNKNLVRNCLEAMLDINDIDVSVKCRIGIGNNFNYEFFFNFIEEIKKSGINIIYVHARNAILNGLSPKNNRTIPPLNYEFVKKIKNEFPKMNFVLNGGINSIEEGYKLFKIYDGIMIGRLIQTNPFSLLEVDRLFYNQEKKVISKQKIISEYFEYIKFNIGKDSIFRLLSPLLCIFFGFPNSKKFKNEIQTRIKNHEIENLESLFLKFIIEQKDRMLQT